LDEIDAPHCSCEETENESHGVIVAEKEPHHPMVLNPEHE
jgi:hypothetical protein